MGFNSQAARENGPITDPLLNPFPDPSCTRKLFEKIRHKILVGRIGLVNEQFEHVFVF